MLESAQCGVAVNQAVERFVRASGNGLPDTESLSGHHFVNQSLCQ